MPACPLRHEGCLGQGEEEIIGLSARSAVVSLTFRGPSTDGAQDRPRMSIPRTNLLDKLVMPEDVVIYTGLAAADPAMAAYIRGRASGLVESSRRMKAHADDCRDERCSKKMRAAEPR